MLKPTTRDPDYSLTCHALALMDWKRELWHRWQEEHFHQCECYGETREFFSGTGRSAAPSEVRRRLRDLAGAQNWASDNAYIKWQRAGRRPETLRRIVQGTGEPFAFSYC